MTGRPEPTYPAWKRNMFRYLVSVPVIFLCLLLVFIIMIITLQLQEWWDQKITEQGYFFCLSYLPKILLAVVITMLDEAYYKVACWLNDKENYRLETKYENHLIVKVALFQFVNSFLSLFYIAFYLQDMEKLKEQLAALLIARQVIGNLKESAIPYMLEQLRLAKMSFDLFGALSPSEAKKELPSNQTEEPSETSPTNKPTGTSRSISQAELESSLFKYDEHLQITWKCLSSWGMWFFSRRPSLWQRSVPSLTTSSRSAVMPSSCASPFSGPSAREFLTLARGRMQWR